MDEVDLGSHPLFRSPGVQYEIVDVDDGRGHTEQIIITNDPFQGLSSQQEAEADEFIGRRFGKYRPLFNGAVVIAPQSSKLLVSIFGFATVGAVLGLLYPTIATETSPVLFYFGQIVILVCVLLLLWTSGTDPGVIPRDFNLTQYLAQVRPNSLERPELRPRWCRKCQSARPSRCYHCRECDICIHRQDMHLLVGGVCIGSRNFRQYLAFNTASSVLAFYILGLSATLVLKILDKYPKDVAFTRLDFHLSCILIFCGATLTSFPQTGFIMFVYRMYLISRNRTMREEYRAFLRANDFNPFDVGILLNVWEFLGKPTEPSYLRRKKNQIDPCTDARHRWREVVIPDRRESNALYFPSNLFDPPGARRNLNMGQGCGEIERQQALNSQAKVKSHYSMPMLENGELPTMPGLRIRRTLNPRPLDLLEQQIKHYQFCQALPKSVQSCKKFKSVYRSLSESCLAEGGRDVADILHEARAHQIQQIISCVLRRDRRGLIELARRIDVAGLVGMDRFDPDDIQMIELNNGLPLLSARSSRRNPLSMLHQQQRDENQPVQRRAASLGIPQMVAAGLMPTIRRQQQEAATALALARIHDYTSENRLIFNAPSPTNSSLFVPAAAAAFGAPHSPLCSSRRSMFRSERQRRRSLFAARVNAAASRGNTTAAICTINNETTAVPLRSRMSVRARPEGVDRNNNNGSNSVVGLAVGSRSRRRSSAGVDCERCMSAATAGRDNASGNSGTDSSVCVVFVDNNNEGSRQRPGS